MMVAVDLNPLIAAVAALIVAATPVLVLLLNARVAAGQRAQEAQTQEVKARVEHVAASVAGIRGAVAAQRGTGLPAGVKEDRRARQ